MKRVLLTVIAVLGLTVQCALAPSSEREKTGLYFVNHTFHAISIAPETVQPEDSIASFIMDVKSGDTVFLGSAKGSGGIAPSSILSGMKIYFTELEDVTYLGDSLGPIIDSYWSGYQMNDSQTVWYFDYRRDDDAQVEALLRGRFSGVGLTAKWSYEERRPCTSGYVLIDSVNHLFGKCDTCPVEGATWEYTFSPYSFLEVYSWYARASRTITTCYPYYVSGDDTVPGDSLTCSDAGSYKVKTGSIYGIDSVWGVWVCTQDSIFLKPVRHWRTPGGVLNGQVERYRYRMDASVDSLYLDSRLYVKTE